MTITNRKKAKREKKNRERERESSSKTFRGQITSSTQCQALYAKQHPSTVYEYGIILMTDFPTKELAAMKPRLYLTMNGRKASVPLVPYSRVWGAERIDDWGCAAPSDQGTRAISQRVTISHQISKGSASESQGHGRSISLLSLSVVRRR